MKPKNLTIKIIFATALFVTAGFFIYKGVAGPMKIVTTGTASVKINTPETNKLTSGLVGYWTFDGQDTNWTSPTAGTVTDRSGQGNTGTLTNMSRSTSPTIGKVGQALNFDGTNDRVETNDAGDLFGPLTVSAWIYSKGSGSNQTIVGDFEPFCEDFLYEFKITSANKLASSVGDYIDCVENTYTSTDSISLNQWQYVVVVRNSSNQLTFYINGSQDSGGWQSYDHNSENNYGVVKIGSRRNEYGVSSNFFNGSIDEVRIYDRVLSASEITELYNQGR